MEQPALGNPTGHMYATGLLTFFSWFVIIYRIGIPGTLSVFVAALSLCLVIYAARSSRPWVAIIAGLVLGASLYVFKGYVIYFSAIWVATLFVALLHPALRRQWTVYLFLDASLIAGAVMLEFYLTTDYLTRNLQSQYKVSGADLLSFPRHLNRMSDVLMYVHIPPTAGGFGFDGIIPKPLLHPVVAIFSWIGLVDRNGPSHPGAGGRNPTLPLGRVFRTDYYRNRLHQQRQSGHQTSGH